MRRDSPRNYSPIGYGLAPCVDSRCASLVCKHGMEEDEMLNFVASQLAHGTAPIWIDLSLSSQPRRELLIFMLPAALFGVTTPVALMQSVSLFRF